ncbi:hypothetical protein [Oceanobacillus jeddahense]|uniref:hypothetical protein n=1 Tax=Oceanobacillus jeddahense TaxID=1462527 RepID=UPI000ACBFEB0|nr:hypothetical protein [Oceanobacillus jeddahense]
MKNYGIDFFQADEDGTGKVFTIIITQFYKNIQTDAEKEALLSALLFLHLLI